MKKTDAITFQAHKTFRYVLDRMYDPKIQNEVVRLGGGYPTPGLLQLPQKIKRSLFYYLTSGESERPGYDAEGGAIPVRTSIAKHENETYGTRYEMENIALTAGVTYGTNRILEILFSDKPDKELLIVAPTFYKGLHRASSLCQTRSIIISEEKKFVPSATDILPNTNEKTLAVFMCNPGNPSGKYIEQQQLKTLIEALRRRGIFLIIDEVQDNFSFLKESYCYGPWINSPNVIRLRSVSKEFTLAEYRLGYVIANRKIIGDNHRGLIQLVGYDMGNPAPVLNHFFIHALSFNKKPWQKIVHRQKNLAVRLLKRIGAIEIILEPEAAFNLTFKFRHPTFKKDTDLFNALIEKRVAMMPLSGFGYKADACWMRLTFASPDVMLKVGLSVLARLLKTKP